MIFSDCKTNMELTTNWKLMGFVDFFFASLGLFLVGVPLVGLSQETCQPQAPLFAFNENSQMLHVRSTYLHLPTF